MKKYFNTQVVYNQQPDLIDRVNGIIKGIVVVQLGEAKGHKLFLDDSFIDKVQDLGNQSNVGIKARFGHPNICSTALGTYLGRYKNFRKSDDKILADLHLDKSAAKSPKGNLYDYILDLAESNPDMFGASIAFNSGKEIIKKIQENGKEFERRFAVIKSLYAVDFVDDPAVTDGLFEAFHEDDFAYQVTTFFDEHPEVFKLIDSKPQILDGFLDKYKQHKQKKFMNIKDEITNLKNWVSDNFSRSDPDVDLQAEVNSKIAQLESGHAELVEAWELERANETKELETVFQTLASFSEKFNTDFSAIKLETDTKLLDKLSAINNVFSQIETLVQSKDDEIALLQSKLNKSLANPTVPNVNADPKIGIDNNKNVDFTGKAILENIPSTLRRKLKK